MTGGACVGAVPNARDEAEAGRIMYQHPSGRTANDAGRMYCNDVR